MRNPAQHARPSVRQYLPARSSLGRILFLGLLLVAAIPAAILTCVLMLPFKVFSWIFNKS